MNTVNCSIKKFKSDNLEKNPASSPTSSCPTSSSLDSPKSLLQISIQFIALNIHLVDSLFGFPDIVGIQIFEKADEFNKFQYADKSCQIALNLFCESYEDMVLNSLSVAADHLCFNQFYDNIILFRDLFQLDLSANGIGDDHDILHHISNLQRLKTLSLRNNHISDDGIRKLTSPIRIMKRGPINLLHLDLSDNTEVTSRAVRYLKCFKDIEVVDISSTSVKQTQIKSDLREMELKITSKESTVFCIQTKGWAKNTVESWKSSQVTDKPSKLLNKNFYKRSKKPVLEHLMETESSNRNSKRLVLIRDRLEAKSSHCTSKHHSCDTKQTKTVLKPIIDNDIDDMQKLYGHISSKSPKVTLSSLMDSW